MREETARRALAAKRDVMKRSKAAFPFIAIWLPVEPLSGAVRSSVRHERQLEACEACRKPSARWGGGRTAHADGHRGQAEH